MRGLDCVRTSALRARDLRRGQTSPRKVETCPIRRVLRSESRFGRQNCAELGKSQGAQPKISPFSGRMRAGQTSPIPMGIRRRWYGLQVVGRQGCTACATTVATVGVSGGFVVAPPEMRPVGVLERAQGLEHVRRSHREKTVTCRSGWRRLRFDLHQASLQP